jgi:hypothetical protein
MGEGGDDMSSLPDGPMRKWVIVAIIGLSLQLLAAVLQLVRLLIQIYRGMPT